MGDIVAGVVLAAGAGTRLRPLTRLRPKALCPVAGVPLVDRALAHLEAAGLPVAVNVHHGREQLEAHLAGRVHLSFEPDRALGTAGGVARLASWLDGRGALVLNADTVSGPDLGALVDGWDGRRTRLLLQGGGPLGPGSRLVASLLPWPRIRSLEAVVSGLYERVFVPARDAGELEIVDYDGFYADCGTPADYLDANLRLNGGRSVVGDGARVEGEIRESVVWPGAVVRPGEHLVRAVRADHRMTVLVRPVRSAAS